MTSAYSTPGITLPLDPALIFKQYMALNQLVAGRLNGEMGGRLVFYGQLDDRGSSIAFAASIAGAASLGVSSDAEILKLAIRNGVCDFMVNNLDEALRILKNEIRKKQPVSVCLELELGAVVEEIAARGVQPDILALTPENDCFGARELLLERGSIELPSTAAGNRTEQLGIQWSVEGFPALWLPKVDALAAEIVGDELRCRWLRLAPRYFGRRAHSLRYVEMSGQERETFLRSIRQAIDDGKVQIPIIVRSDGKEERFAPAG